MDPKQITALAKLLKDSGDKVLNCEYKLSLSGSLLRALNDAFSLIVDKNETFPPQSFQVVKPHNAKSDVFRDIQFIYDFVQKTFILSLNQFINDDPYEFEVDISKFRSLRKLEVQKIPISQIIGIQQMRSQLNEIVCIRSLSHVKEVITTCGGDNSNGFTWNELKAANFSYNMLDHIDSSLEFTPWLENLNLSHNRIVSVSAIKWLPNLRVLNLSYNRLTHIPSFHVDATRKIQVLYISNNFIEELSGISRLLRLSELDVSGNCIVDHTALLPVSTLSCLCFLNLKDNPLACHPKHRQATARYLNRNTSTSKIVLDDEPLSKYEKTLTGNYDSYHAILTPRLPGSVTSSGINTPTRKSALNTPTGSVSSKSSFRMEPKDEMSTSIISQKKIKVRRAIICDDDPSDKVSQYGTKQDVSTKENSLETSCEHLETKKQIENLRKKYGSEWLQSQAGDMVKNVIGFDPSMNKEFESVLHYEGERKKHKAGSAPVDTSSRLDYTGESIRTSTPVDRDSSMLMESCESPIKFQSGRRSDGVASEADFKSVIPDDNSSNYQSISDGTIGNASNSLILNDIYANVVEEESESDEEENERIYFVKRKGNPKDIILVVSDVSIREKDGDKTKTRWGIKTLEACERPTSTSITLLFDTIKKDKKTRTYEVDDQSCQELESFLRGILSKRPLSEMNQKLFDCVVCKARFSREISSSKFIDDLQCPECSQAFCVEITESPAKWNLIDQSKRDDIGSDHPTETVPDLAAPLAGPSGMSNILKQSGSKTSIGSTGSLNDSSSCSRISQPSSSCDSNRSVAGSTNSERDRDVDLIGNDSDIEVLSNPSQSSIEVLDRGFHPSRKHSEERKNLQLPGLEVVQGDDSLNNISTTLINQETSTHDLIVKVANSFNKIIKFEDATVNDKENSVTPKPNQSVLSHKKSFLTAANLTESSSSGSVTDSVCTAYETNQDPKQNSSSEVTTESEKSKKEPSLTKPGLDSPASKPDNSVISAVLGGLFQSTNMLMSKTPKPIKSDPPTNLPFEPIKYSYADYANVDHRLKLYLYQNLFEDTNETLKWLVSCVIFDENQLDKWPTGFDGLFIMSTTKFYVMKKIASENHDPSSWMKKHLSGTIDRVGIAQVLPWKIGMKFFISAVGGIHIILQDILRTDCLILFFADNPLPEYCTFDYQPSELLTNKLGKATGGEMVKILMVINFCEVLSDDVLQSLQLCTLLLTDSQLYLAPDIKWLNENSKYQIEPKYTQLMSNLIELEDIHSLSCRLNFIDEKEDKYETWRIDFATVTAKESVVSTICNSWQKIFGVPLINSSGNSSSNNNHSSIVSNTSQVNDSNIIENITN
ncbi:serine/threonine-protein kinase 11-interacting protein isoform X2 [Armigeres subalbatus]|uniref:serine/threonine-protein kinase 11-interacting protein isoform X2 n=1 Tax=Armigeres subalbatus TaxID=124917 RepID=UPI002ED50463